MDSIVLTFQDSQLDSLVRQLVRLSVLLCGSHIFYNIGISDLGIACTQASIKAEDLAHRQAQLATFMPLMMFNSVREKHACKFNQLFIRAY